MSEYIEPMFAVPIFHLYAEDWDRKKKLLQALSSHQEFKKEPGEYVPSDFRSKKVEWTKIELVIRDELEKFKNEVTLPNLNVDAYWFEKGGRGDQHLIHNHELQGLVQSCILTMMKRSIHRHSL